MTDSVMNANVRNASIVSSSSTQRVKLANTGATNINIYNNGTVEAFVWFGDETVTADATCRVVGPGYTSFELEANPNPPTYGAAICPTGTPTIYFHAGTGN